MHYALQERKCLLHDGRDYFAFMADQASRLRAARERAGYDSAKMAAEAMGCSASTYIQHENGTRGYPKDRAERYARFFRVTPQWLLYGHGKLDDLPAPPNEAVLEEMLRLIVDEIPARASISDWPRLGAPILRDLLERFQADGAHPAIAGATTSHGKGVQPHQPTTQGD